MAGGELMQDVEGAALPLSYCLLGLVLSAFLCHRRKCFKPPADLVSVDLVDNIIYKSTYSGPGELHCIAIS